MASGKISRQSVQGAFQAHCLAKLLAGYIDAILVTVSMSGSDSGVCHTQQFVPWKGEDFMAPMPSGRTTLVYRVRDGDSSVDENATIQCSPKGA